MIGEVRTTLKIDKTLLIQLEESELIVGARVETKDNVAVNIQFLISNTF